MQSLDGALPGLAALGAIGGASGVPDPTDTRARAHHDEADLSADGPRQPATGFIPGGSDKFGEELIPRFSALAIATALTLRAVFRLALRQTEGLIGSILRLLGVDLAVPDHSTLSRRAETLAVPRPLHGCEPVHLLVDSTGLL